MATIRKYESFESFNSDSKDSLREDVSEILNDISDQLDTVEIIPGAMGGNNFYPNHSTSDIGVNPMSGVTIRNAFEIGIFYPKANETKPAARRIDGDHRSEYYMNIGDTHLNTLLIIYGAIARIKHLSSNVTVYTHRSMENRSRHYEKILIVLPL